MALAVSRRPLSLEARVRYPCEIPPPSFIFYSDFFYVLLVRCRGLLLHVITRSDTRTR